MPAATRTRRIVRQKAKGPVDPALGERVRAFREARGMTQAQLASTDFTKGFISLLETGRTRVSLRAAEVLSARLGVAVVDLMRVPETPGETKAEVELLRAQKELADGNPGEALKRLDDIERLARGALRPRWLRTRGRVLRALGRYRDAVTTLDEAARGFRAGSDRESLARTLFDLAHTHASLDQQAEALNLAMQVEALVNDGAVVDRSFELQLLGFLAGVLVNLGDITAADLRTERARAVAEDVTDLRTVADLYYNLAVTRQEQGDGEGALAYVRRSLDAYGKLDDQAAIASTWNTLAWIYTKREQYTRAAEALDRAEEAAASAHSERVLPWIVQSRAELALARGNLAEAIRLADASIAHPSASERCQAQSLLVRAEALGRGKAADAAVIKAFDAAADALTPFGRRLLARAYQAKFAVLAKRGRLKEATVAAARALDLQQPSID
jgi:tetratricopeptide (TPR) repeat protein/DNA-binding XRE family transcriptional regulator